MTDNTQPEALHLADQLDAVPETGADPQTIQDAAAELRRLHAGYAAARLEIESLKAQLADHADDAKKDEHD